MDKIKLALPGEFAAIVEEIAPGENTFEENGEIYSATIGIPTINKEKRTLGIKSIKPLAALRRGDIIIGEIVELFESIAQVEISSVEGNKRTALANKHAFLRISELEKGFVEQLRDHIKTGDVLRAKVIEVNDLGTYLTIAFPEYGVIKACCSRCRNYMELQRDGYTFACKECGSKEQRKTPTENIHANSENTPLSQ